MGAVNKACRKKFTIALVGSEDGIESMKRWLYTFPYPLAYELADDVERRLKVDQNKGDGHLVPIVVSGYDRTVPSPRRNITFCIVEKSYHERVAANGWDAYVFQGEDDATLAHDILDNHDDLSFALSHTFPVFRPCHAQAEIRETALQNTAWAVVTGAPNVIPGGQILAPVEAISDFAVLTVNEVKLMFELVGVSGRVVNPLKCVVELGALLSLAKLAEMTATNTVGKVPAGVGLALKGAVAYAFTWAIGEAIFLYLSTGVKVGKQFFETRIKGHLEEGKAFAEDIAKKRKSSDQEAEG